MNKRFHLDLLNILYDLEDENKLSVDSSFSNPYQNQSYIDQPELFVEVYSNSNGFEISWTSNEIEQSYGHIGFLEMESIFSSWEDVLYNNDDLSINENLKYFRPFDQVSPEILCGFLIKTNEAYESVYLHYSGESSLQYLDVDFEGYVTMLYDAKAYKNWPYILIYIQDNDYENPLIESFKSDMPKIFDDFNWNDFVDKYNSLRLSME